MKKYIYIAVLLLSTLTSCENDSDFLEKEPPNIFTNEQLWKSKELIYQAVADLYSRYVDYQHLGAWYDYAKFSEAFAARSTEWGRHKNTDWGYDEWRAWDYGYIRHLNLFIQQCENATVLDSQTQNRYLGEIRLLRACYYFELTKRMGGVPLILEPLVYDFSGDPTYLRHARAKESEMYDFIIDECDDIINNNLLPDDSNIKSRATKGLALAVKSRAALYAGSIAKYGAKTPTVKLDQGEVGIDASKANEYYEKALNAAQELIKTKKYSLYKKYENNLEENFAQLFLDKNNNPEVIFIRDYLAPKVTHQFTVFAIPRSMQEDTQFSGGLNPSLNLVQSFEMLDNTFKPLALYENGIPVAYQNPEDAFAGRDARLKGSIIVPGSEFRGKKVDIQAGYFNIANQQIISGSSVGAEGKLPDGATAKLIGADGPCNAEFCTNTGFYIRKYNDTKPGTGSSTMGSEVPWIRYRYAEILLNAAEASFELNNGLAASYLNEVRRRAGFQTDLTENEITFDRIVHERKVELAFEGHDLWDMKRWRLAHEVWNGTRMSEADFTTKELGKANECNTEVWGLWPYKVYAKTGNPQYDKFNDQWIYLPKRPSNVTTGHRFRMGNYYSRINEGDISKNPKLTQNPNQ